MRDEAALHKLVVDLRAIAVTAKPVTKALTPTVTSDKPPAKSARTSKRIEHVSPAPAPEPVPLSQTASKDSDGKVKTKKKKKKRSVLANQGNPHHVDNCKCHT